jgi:hypothetical protein
MAYHVEVEDFVRAVQTSTTTAEMTEAVAGLLCEVLKKGLDNRKLQNCVAALLREQGWICSPPAPEEQPAPRRKARG